MSLSPSVRRPPAPSRRVIAEASEDEEEGAVTWADAYDAYNEVYSKARRVFADEHWERVDLGALEEIVHDENVELIMEVTSVLEQVLDEIGEDPDENGGSQQGSDEDDEDEEERAVGEAPMVSAPDDGGVVLSASAQTVEHVLEPRLTQYAGRCFGIPDGYVVHHGEEMPFESADAMNAMLNSKSPDEWKAVRTRHITIIRNDKRVVPEGWWEGKPDAPKKEELPFETFMYINPYVNAEDDDAEGLMAQECDKRHFRHLHKQVAQKLQQRFGELEKAQDHRRATIAPILDWVPASGPQVKPDVVDWPEYKYVQLQSCFSKRVAAPRPKGSQKGGKRPGSPVIMPAFKPTGTAPSKRKNRAANSEDGEASSSTAHRDEEEGVRQSLGYRCFRTIDVHDSAKTHVYTMNNKVYIVEH
jgi:hypothetical protein